MASRRVLIVEDRREISILKDYAWVDFINDDDDIELYILTTTDGLTEKDKKSPRLRDYKEIDKPTTDGTLELYAYEMHKKYSFTHIYVDNEDLMIRSAHIRALLNIKTGLSPQLVPYYRDKVRMKETAAQGGFPVPPFARLYAPADLIGFIEKHGYPVVVKPTLGCATAGLHLIKTEEELQKYLSTTLFGSIELSQRMDLVGELTVEAYMKGTMYHVDGIANNGRIIHAWPFTYLHTCLGFSQEGKAYGNSSIPRSDPRYDRLCKTAQRFLDILPTPSDGLVFHLELYENLDENRLPEDDYVLCEIAARAPGASITHLMDLLSFSNNENESFHRIAFRISVSLPIPTIAEEPEDKVVTDLFIPRELGTLMFIPRECPIENLEYIPLADVNTPTVYEKYDICKINSSCRFIAQTKTMKEGLELVEKGMEWFENTHINKAPDEPCTATLLKELHRYFHRKIFL